MAGQKKEREVEEIMEIEEKTIFEGDLHPVAAQRVLEDDIKAQSKYRIVIHNQEGATGTMPVFVAVNGLGMHIPREVEVTIPLAILKALENASETRYFRETMDDKAFGPMISREVRRFPFSILGKE